MERDEPIKTTDSVIYVGDEPVVLEKGQRVPRDRRWRKVKAYMGPVYEFPLEWFEMGIDISKWMEITIDLEYNGFLYWSYQRIHMDDWNDLIDQEGVLDFILTEMVKQIDERMENDEGFPQAASEEGGRGAR